jgi:hypothetical protein
VGYEGDSAYPPRRNATKTDPRQRKGNYAGNICADRLVKCGVDRDRHAAEGAIRLQ